MSNSANITQRSNKQGNSQLSQLAGKTYSNAAQGSIENKNQPATTQKTDFMQTQTFHRRNMSNLINMSEEDDMPDHMLISRGGPPRRTLEQIEQGSNYEEGGCGANNHDGSDENNNIGGGVIDFAENLDRGPGAEVDNVDDDDDMGLMDSQESAAENADFQDNISNQRNKKENDHELIPKGGFFDMVEHPSIRDDEQMEMIDENVGRNFNFAQKDDTYDEDETNDGQTFQAANKNSQSDNQAVLKQRFIGSGGQESDGDEFHHDGNGDFPMTGRKDKMSNLRLDDSGRDGDDLSEQEAMVVGQEVVITPGGQSNQIECLLSPNPYDNDFKMELSELHNSNKARAARHDHSTFEHQSQVPLTSGNQNNFHAPNKSQQAAQRASPSGEISQATNESCSSLDTMGHQMMLNANANSAHQASNSAQKDRNLGNTPSQAYGGNYGGQHRPSNQRAMHHHHASNEENNSAQMQVYQYYNPEDDVQSSHGEENEEVVNESSQEASRIINTASPSPVKKAANQQKKKKHVFKELQIEIDSDDDVGNGNNRGQVQGKNHHQKPKAPPSAPKQQSNFIQFEEVEGSAHIQDEMLHGGRVSNAYQLYGGGGHHVDRSAGGGDCDTPGLSREQQISSQKMLTPNEQRMHSSYFPNDAGLQRALPSTKSYQTPVTYGNSNLNSSQNPFMAATDGIGASGGPHINHRVNSNSFNMAPLDTGNETNSVSTANPQYYYLKGNGLIGVGQQESQSRASDRIYEKAHVQGSMSPGANVNPNGHNSSYSDLQQHIVKKNLSLDHQQKSQQYQRQYDSMMLAGENNINQKEQDERMEAEIRRLEELNRIEAQRLREPMTDEDEEIPSLAQQEAELRRLQEEETRQNCPDEYNLLSATHSQDNVESVEALKNTSQEYVNQAAEGVSSPNTSQLQMNNHGNGGSQGKANGAIPFKQVPQATIAALANDNDLNDRESAASGGENTSINNQIASMPQMNQLSANGSFRTSSVTGGDRASRRLYVITEESQSMAGGQTTMDPSRAAADYATMKQIWSQQARSGGLAISQGNNMAAGSVTLQQQAQSQNPFLQGQTALGYGFLKASTHSQELPLYDPSSRRLTVGSSNNTAENRTSLLLDGTPNMLDLPGSQPQQSLNQTMQVHSSPQVQTFNAYCHQDNESSSITDQQFISMAQINPSADASVVKDCQDAMLHQRSKSQSNSVVVTNFATMKQQINQSQLNQQQFAANNINNNITIREETSSPLQIYNEDGSKNDGYPAYQQNISMTAGKDQQNHSHPSKFQQQQPMLMKNPGQVAPSRSATTSTAKQANASTLVLEQNNPNFNAASIQYPNNNGASNSVKLAQSNQGSQPYLYAQFNASANAYTGQQEAQHQGALMAMQSSHASTFQRDQDLMSAYLKQTSTLTTNDRRPTNSHLQVANNGVGGEHGRQFEIASDEDLLNSNFDRISKILPNHEQINEQLPDFNPEESAQNSPHRNTHRRDSTDQTNNLSQVVQYNNQHQMLLAEIQQLKQTILQRNQVIMIKDNTISELKNEFGLRSSIAGLTTQQEAEMREVGTLAHPDTRDVKTQTHGPRKQAYYRSIPAKVYTNLPHRSPSNSLEHSHDCSNDYGSHNAPIRASSFQRQSKMSSFAGVTAAAQGSGNNSPGRGLHQANSNSPSRRRASPPKGTTGADGGSQTNEDIRSLRLQLMSLKKQLNAQEQDNMTLIEKVTSLEDTIATQEKNYDRLQMELEEKAAENESLIERNEELMKQVDSLLADNTELRQQKSSMSLTSDQIHRLLQDRKAADTIDNEAQTEDYLWQDFLSNQQYNSRVNQSIPLAQQQQQYLQMYNDQQSDQKEMTGRSVPQSTTQHSQLIVHHIHQPISQTSQQTGALGAGLLPSNHNSRVLDQLSEVISAQELTQQQTITLTNDQDRIQILAERAKSYEQQQSRIEQEIAQYKKLLLDVQIPQAASNIGQNQTTAMVMMAAAMSSNQQQPNASLGPQPFNLGGAHHSNTTVDNAVVQCQHGHHSSDLLNISDATNVKQINVNHYHHNQTQQQQQQLQQQQQQQQQQHHLRQPSNISASPPNVNIQEYMNTQDYMLRSGGTMSFEFNKNSSQNLQTTTGGLGATQQAHQLIGALQGQQMPNGIVDLNQLGAGPGQTSAGIVSMNQQQQIGYLHNKCVHQKRKIKKLSKKNQKLEFEKMQIEQIQLDMTKSMDQLNEKYRDLRAKYQLKLQEKNLKISELKNLLQQRTHQIFTGSTTPLAPTNANSTHIHSQPPVYHPNHLGLPQQQTQQSQIICYGDNTSSNNNQPVGPQQQMVATTPAGADLSSEGGRGETAQTRNNFQQQKGGRNNQRVDTSQEDNKGQQRVKRRGSPMPSSSFQNQQRAITVSNTNKSGDGGNFYTIVSGMVDQRMAEHGTQEQNHLEGNQRTNTATAKSSKHYQSNKGNHCAIMQSMNKLKKSVEVFVDHDDRSPADERKRYRSRNSRPDLEILRDNRNTYQSKQQQQFYQPQKSPSDQLISRQNLVSSSDEKVYDNEDDAHGDLNDRALPSGSSKKNQAVRQGRNSQPQLMFHQTHKERKTKNVMMTYSSSPKNKQPLNQKETLAESYARKVQANNTANSKHQYSCSPDNRESRHHQKKASKKKHITRSKSSEKPQPQRQVQKRDQSLRSVLSKDDVMPCYKYKVDGRKRNHVEYIPPVSLLTYLATQTGQNQDQSHCQVRSPIISSSSQSPPPARQNIYHPGQRFAKQGSCSQETRRRQQSHRAQEGAAAEGNLIEHNNHRQNVSYY